MSNKRVANRPFWESAISNNQTFINFYQRLFSIAISRFEYDNLPDTVDRRFLELALFCDGQALFFKDDVIGFLGLRCSPGGALNVYGYPTVRRAYAANGYTATRDESNSVLIYDNNEHYPAMRHIEMFAYRLYTIERAIDTNVNSQRTPFFITCDENQRLTFKNIMMQYDGNTPIIWGQKGINLDAIKVFPTTAPYVAKNLQELKMQIWNEALTYLGVSNANFVKRERLISDEVARSMGGVVASRYSPLEQRLRAVEKINKMFGLNIEVRFHDTTEEYISTEILGSAERSLEGNEDSKVERLVQRYG